MSIIRLKNMKFSGFHGVNDFEKNNPALFEVDLDINTSFNKAIESDSLNDAINYELIFKTVKSCVINNSYDLIESLANIIAKEIIINFPVISLVVRVRKPNAPIKGIFDTIEVEINRDKTYYA